VQISEILAVLNSQFSGTNLGNFVIICESILSLSGKVTMLPISRMSGLSYRTIQRFYGLKNINWLVIRLLLFKQFVYKPSHHYLLVGDETVEGKAGKSTHGINRFYSSIAQRAINSVSFLALSLVDVTTEKSWTIALQQLIKKQKIIEIKPTKSSKTLNSNEPKGKKGRPKGSKNKIKTESKGLSYEQLKGLIILVNGHFASFLPNLQCFFLVLDGFYGCSDYVLLAIANKLKLISKFKSNASLFLPFEGIYQGKGRPKTKGNKVNLANLDKKNLIQTKQEKDEPNIITHIYSLKAYTPTIKGKLLNIVVLIHENTETKRIAKNILFSSDLELTAQEIIKYYSLRFQIEFDFRDAKQHFGLADFKNFKETQVYNAVNIAFTMTIISRIVLEKYKIHWACHSMGILDLKALFRVKKYTELVLKCNHINPIDFLNSQNFLKIAQLETIHL
jgi:putative transposase